MRIFENDQHQYDAYGQTFLRTETGRAVLKDMIVNVPVAVEGDELTVTRFLKELLARTGVLHPENLDSLLTKLGELPTPRQETNADDES